MKIKPETVKKTARDYLNLCREKGQLATVCGLAAALDMSEQSLNALREHPRYREILGCFDAASEDLAVNSERKNAALYLKARCRYSEKGEEETAVRGAGAVERIPLSEKEKLIRQML